MGGLTGGEDAARFAGGEPQNLTAGLYVMRLRAAKPAGHSTWMITRSSVVVEGHGGPPDPEGTMTSRGGEDAEFEQFVRASWRSLRQAAYVLTGSTEDAEDLLQAVLARTFARWSRVRRDDPVAYVRRALVNAYVDQWRRRRVLTEQPTDTPPDRVSTDATAGHDRLADREHLAFLLAALSPRERAMVVLRYYFDRSEAEVADALGCSVGTVKSTCSRALVRLRIPTPQEDRG